MPDCIAAVSSTPFSFQTHIWEPIRDTVYKCIEVCKRFFQDIFGSILRVCVLQEGALQGRCSKNFTAPITRFILNTWQRCQGISNLRSGVDEARLEKGERFLQPFALKGKFNEVVTEDNQNIRLGIFTAKDFWNKLESIQKANLIDIHEIKENGITYVRYDACTDDAWKALDPIKEFRCFEINEEEKTILIPKRLEKANSKYILRFQGFGRKIPMDKKYIGLHLALGFNYAVFDWRETGNLTDYYKDAEAVYQYLAKEKKISPTNIIAQGFCRTTFVASHLQSIHNQDGLNACLIDPMPSLEDTIKRKGWFVRNLALMGLESLKRTGDNFNNIEQFQDKEIRGRTIIALQEGDKTLPEDTAELFQNALSKGHYEQLQFKTHGDEDPHFADPLMNKENLFSYAKALIGK